VSLEGRTPLVIWDLDGTLVRLNIAPRTVADWKARLREYFEPFGWTDGFSPLLPSLESALATSIEPLKAESPETVRSRIYGDLDRWEKEAVRDIEVIVQPAEWLFRWSAGRFPMALVTNNGRPVVDLALDVLDTYALRHRHPLPRFDAIVARDPEIRAKPDPAGMLHAIESVKGRIGPDRGAVLVIGDSLHDWEAADALADRVRYPVLGLRVSDDDRLDLHEISFTVDPDLALGTLFQHLQLL
jgi:phosphoglycolate phosphatase-like HAD superfamily hydrolase